MKLYIQSDDGRYADFEIDEKLASLFAKEGREKLSKFIANEALIYLEAMSELKEDEK